jgi:hypothetical protein
MLVVRPDFQRNVRIGENRRGSVGLRDNSGALDVLVVPETYVDRRIPYALQQLRTTVFTKHTFTKCSEFFPFVSSVLGKKKK